MAYLPTFWLRCVANVRKYTIHGSYGYCCVSSFSTAAWLAFSNKREPPEVFIKDSKRAWVFNLDILQRVDRTSGFPKTNETKKPESNSIRGFWRFTTKYEKNFVDVVFSGYYTFIILKEKCFQFFFSVDQSNFWDGNHIYPCSTKKKKHVFLSSDPRPPGSRVVKCWTAKVRWLNQGKTLAAFCWPPKNELKVTKGLFYRKCLELFHDLFHAMLKMDGYIWIYMMFLLKYLCLMCA